MRRCEGDTLSHRRTGDWDRGVRGKVATETHFIPSFHPIIPSHHSITIYPSPIHSIHHIPSQSIHHNTFHPLHVITWFHPSHSPISNQMTKTRKYRISISDLKPITRDLLLKTSFFQSLCVDTDYKSTVLSNKVIYNFLKTHPNLFKPESLTTKDIPYMNTTHTRF